ncbi:MAG: DUF192 domain-containing protein [Alphaproteobacteria bacterium]
MTAISHVWKRFCGPLLRAAVAAVLVAAAASAGAGDVTFATESLVLETETGAHPLTVEIAETAPQLERGLMFRRALADESGMLFLYERDDFIMMWMKNTYLSLDMLFIDRHGRVVRVAERTTPLSRDLIPSLVPIRAVLEVKAGTAKRLGVKAGSIVRYRAFGNATGGR